VNREQAIPWNIIMTKASTDRLRALANATLLTQPRLFATPQANAERRRAALRRLLAKYGYTPTELARMAGYKRANAIYNFLNGRANALSLEAVERILTVLPGVNFEELVGWTADGHAGRPDPAKANNGRAGRRAAGQPPKGPKTMRV
jgi:hypothetical protein